MRVARAFSPAGLSGFFSVYITPGEPLRSGAKGGGFTLGRGVIVRVEAEEASETSVKTLLEGRPADMNVARKVAERILALKGEPFHVTIDQRIEVPIGGGLGTSGASALATALAVASAIGVKATYTELARIAHVVEVEAGTGLGTVSGLAVGGFVLVVKPGPPGADRVERIPIEPSMRVVVGFFSPMSKRAAMSSVDLGRINRLGEEALARVLEDPSPERFVEESWKFALKAGLATPRVMRGVEVAIKNGAIGASQAMIGETVYALADPDVATSIKEEFEALGARSFIAGVDWCPARLL